MEEISNKLISENSEDSASITSSAGSVALHSDLEEQDSQKIYLCSLLVSHVKETPLMGTEKDNLIIAGSGMKLSMPFAYYDPDSQSLKTSQACLPWTIDEPLIESSPIWPRSGLLRNGLVYELPTLAHRTRETGYSLFPTPKASDQIRLKMRSSISSLAKTYFHDLKTGRGPELSEVLAGEFGKYPTPELVEWLIGLPETWTDIEQSEME